MACAFIVSAITLILPLCIRYITKNVLEGNMPNALNQIYMMGAVMLALVVVYTVCNIFVDFQGHMMGLSWKEICAANYSNITKNYRLIFTMNKKQVN